MRTVLELSESFPIEASITASSRRLPGSSCEIRAERLVGTLPMPHRMRAVGGARMDDNGRQQIRDRSMPLREGASLRKQVS